MPIKLINTPPYYEVVNYTAIKENYKPLFQQLEAVANDSNTLTLLYQTFIPANTITENGQKLLIKYVLQLAGGISEKNIQIGLNGTNYDFTTITHNGVAVITIEITRTDSTTMKGFYRLETTDTIEEIALKSSGGFDFTLPIHTAIQAQGEASNEIILQVGHIDLILQP